MGVTIQTAAERTAMTTRAVVKQAMKIESSDTTQDGLIDRLISAATRALQEYSGRVFARQTYLESVAGTAHPYLILTNTPIVSVSQVIADSDVITDFSIHDAEAGILYRQLGWNRKAWWGYDVEPTLVPGTDELTIFVTHISGYQMPGEGDRDLPEDFEEACVRTVSSWMRVDQRGGADVSERKVGDLSIKYRDPESDAENNMALPPDARALVGRRAV